MSSTVPDIAPSPLRAWLALVGVCIRRQAKSRQMLWLALGILAIVIANVLLARYRSGLTQNNWRDRKFPNATYSEIERGYASAAEAIPFAPEAASFHRLATAAFAMGLKSSPVPLFTKRIIFSLFLGFLLPLLSLSFATEALGGEREARTTVWLMTRPLPRWSVYLAKFLGILPWTLALNFGGFALICLAAGPPGKVAFWLYWPAVLMSSVAFSALFHLFGAWFRRPTVIGLVYAFFLETLLGDMPGLMKRISITFYSRCLIYDAAADYGLAPDKPSVYLPVSGSMAWTVLALATLVLLVVGMIVFSRAEYRDES